MTLADAPVQYARNDDGEQIAYIMFGSGPNLIRVSSGMENIDISRQMPSAIPWGDRVTANFSLAMFDRRGSGLSDPLPATGVAALETCADDIRAVMRAAGMQRANVLAHDFGTMFGILFAATYPELVERLVLIEPSPRMRQAPEYPFGVPDQMIDVFARLYAEEWGNAKMLEFAAPEAAKDPEMVAFWKRFERASMSPSVAKATFEAFSDMDVRHALGSIQAETLVLFSPDTPFPAGAAEFVAQQIPNAKIEVVHSPNGIWFFYDGVDEGLEHVEKFLLGSSAPRASDRMLATVLFTDIVDSTGHATRLGDHAWRDLVQRHDQITRTTVQEFRGQPIESTGDGHLAMFDGPGRGVEAARSLGGKMRDLGIEIRCGLHTGEVEKRGEGIAGIAVHLAARVLSKAEAGEVLVSRTVVDLVAGSGLTFEDRGTHQLKGVTNEWQIFALTN